MNGTNFTGEFQDIPALIDSMNVWDPDGNWAHSNVGQSIVGGNPDNTYSNVMIIEALNFGTSSTLGTNSTAVPNGFSIQLDTGYHEVIIIDTDINCSDTLLAIVTCPDNSTICVGEVGTICIDTTSLDLSGPISSANKCLPGFGGWLSAFYPG